MVSAGIAGLPTDLLGDVSWRVPPLRRTDALTMLSELGEVSDPLIRTGLLGQKLGQARVTHLQPATREIATRISMAVMALSYFPSIVVV